MHPGFTHFPVDADVSVGGERLADPALVVGALVDLEAVLGAVKVRPVVVDVLHADLEGHVRPERALVRHAAGRFNRKILA